MFGDTPPETVQLRTFGFGLRGLRKNRELIPLTTIMGFALSWAVFNLLWALRHKTDIKIRKGKGHALAPWEYIKPTDKHKYHIVNPQLYRPIPELEELKREIGSYRP